MKPGGKRWETKWEPIVGRKPGTKGVGKNSDITFIDTQKGSTHLPPLNTKAESKKELSILGQNLAGPSEKVRRVDRRCMGGMHKGQTSARHLGKAWKKRKRFEEWWA